MPHPSRLARLLRQLRNKHKLSVNRLARLSGISRRTLARLEGGGYTPSPRIAARLVKLLLPREQFEQTLADATRLSRTLGDDPLYKLLDVLYHYPSFLFHDTPADRVLREQFGSDYRDSLDLLLRSGFGTRNLGRRLRAFRMRHDLTLIETADLLGLSKSELHRLERGEREPSPRTRYKILRLLTLPLPSPSEAPGVGGPPSRPTRPARRLRREPAGISRGDWLELAKILLALPPPTPSEFEDPSSASGQGDAGSSRWPRANAREAGARDYLERLRYLWLTSDQSTKQLAAQLGIGQPHLIRLLRGDRKPSRQLRQRIAALTPRVSS